MSDILNPIRRLYAEPPEAAGGAPEELGPDEAAEAAALRPVREALDELPPQRPRPDVVEEVVAAATFQAVRRLYDEADEAPAELPAGAAEEAIQLAPVKAALDQLPPRSPDPGVVDDVVAAAASSAVRSLYEQGDARELPRHAAREAALLAPVKKALDRLPAEHPAPEVVDEVVAAAATVAVRSLYEETDAADLSPAAAREVQLLAPVKAALERLPPERPDPAVIDAAVAGAARRRRRTDRARHEREPARRRRRVSRVFGMLGAIALAALATLWVIQQPPIDEPAEQLAIAEPRVLHPELASESPDARPVPPEPEPAREAEREPQTAPRERPASPAQPAPSPTAAGRTVATAAAAPPPQVVHQPTEADLAAIALMASDMEASHEALRLLYLRLEALQEESQLLGEEPRVRSAGIPIRPAVSHGWMQVRIER